MREILFRGKRKDNGEWVEGYYACIGETTVILTGELDFSKWDIKAKMNVIIPETVGQFTGVTDKNGIKIFEGDIVKWDYRSSDGKVYQVKYDVSCACFVTSREHNGAIIYLSFDNDGQHIEILGNIYDNPELLENNTRKDKSI